MAKQLQVRRGITMANDVFIGAEGEITMDTTTKGLRIHDGQTAGGFKIDTLVDFQLPTSSNNYTWYRKYSSGWVEQGGITGSSAGDAAKNITFPIEMADTNYTVQVTIRGELPYGASGNNPGVKNNNTTTGMTIYSGNTGALYWEVKGLAA